MHFKTIWRIIGILLMCFSFSLLIPAIVAAIYRDGEGVTFLLSFMISFSSGFLLWWIFRFHKSELRSREGFLVVVLFWLVLGFATSLPFLLTNSLEIKTADAIFEAFSGLSTTGATALSGLDKMPHAILFHRQLSEFIGGMGVIILAVAVIPLLGVGGASLYKAESSGPLKDKKIMPRISEIAKHLWIVYTLLVIICAICYYAAGMNAFDAISHSFSTISNGGFSTHDASMGAFDNPAIHIIATVFMLFAGFSFSLHIVAFMQIKKGNINKSLFKIYTQDIEARYCLILQLLLICIFSLGLYFSFENYSLSKAFQHGAVHMSSMAMTSGFTIFNANDLPPFLAMMTLLAACIGGCAGSTTGGVKIIRMMILWLQMKKEVRQLIHPNAIINVKLDKSIIPENVLGGVFAFLIMFVLVFWILAFAAMLTGMGVLDSIGATFASITNTGPGIGITSGSFSDVPDSAKYIFAFAMLAGRLEFFSILVLFSPSFWKN